MANPPLSRLRRLQAQAQALLEDRDEILRAGEQIAPSRRWAQFLIRIYRGFIRNRCFVRAAALAYTTVLALVPLLAIGVSVSTAFLKQEGDKPIRELIQDGITKFAPMLDLKPADAESSAVAQEDVVKAISGYIDRFNSGTLGFSAVIAFIFVAISLLSTIEATLNDIWGVNQGRGWVTRVMAYWVTITLGPLFLIGAVGITSASQFRAAQEMLERFTLISTILHGFFLPCLILTVIFMVLFLFMPNTNVDWRAAFVGGAVAGVLLQTNSLLSVLYFTRVVTYHKIYGSMSAVPLFLAGVYVSWLIVLLGAQTAYAFQNRRTYIQQRLADRVNQRGREFIALRLVTVIALRFEAGERPATATDLGEQLSIPLRLVGQVLRELVESKLLVEVAGNECGYYPARPLDRVTVHDVIEALRVGQGDELETADDRSRALVREEFEAVQQAERKASGALTLRDLVERLANQRER